MFPAYLQLAPLPKSINALNFAVPGMLRTTNGKLVSRESHPSEERSEPPQEKQETGVSLYPESASSQSAAPHGVQALC